MTAGDFNVIDAIFSILTPAMGMVVMLAPVLTSGAAIYVAYRIHQWTRDTKRQKVIDAVYHHAKFTQENLEVLKGTISGLLDRMQADQHYTPYPVIPREDNLAYTDIIELMWWLNQAEEIIILRYFHAQANLHATAASFGTEVVRKLPLEQRIDIMNGLAKFCEDTLKRATDVEDVLKDKRKGASKCT